MIVMPANCTGMRIGYLAGRYPGLLGHLFSPGGERGPFPFMPYALDNGAFGAFARGEPWNPSPWIALLEWARDSGQTPRWVLVPDVVGDRAGTLAMWRGWSGLAASFGWPIAFAAQDGMTVDDVPTSAAVVFLGGSTDWKHQAIKPFCDRFPRVHVGRINTYRWLRVCEAAGVESVDGTGWARGDNDQMRGLEQWLSEASGASAREDQTSLSFAGSVEPMGYGSRSSVIAAPAAPGDASSSTLATEA